MIKWKLHGSIYFVSISTHFWILISVLGQHVMQNQSLVANDVVDWLYTITRSSMMMDPSNAKSMGHLIIYMWSWTFEVPELFSMLKLFENWFLNRFQESCLGLPSRSCIFWGLGWEEAWPKLRCWREWTQVYANT